MDLLMLGSNATSDFTINRMSPESEAHTIIYLIVLITSFIYIFLYIYINPHKFYLYRERKEKTGVRLS